MDYFWMEKHRKGRLRSRFVAPNIKLVSFQKVFSKVVAKSGFLKVTCQTKALLSVPYVLLFVKCSSKGLQECKRPVFFCFFCIKKTLVLCHSNQLIVKVCKKKKNYQKNLQCWQQQLFLRWDYFYPHKQMCSNNFLFSVKHSLSSYSTAIEEF